MIQIIFSLLYLHFLPVPLTLLLPPLFLCMTAALADAGCLSICAKVTIYARACPPLHVQEDMPDLVGCYLHHPQNWFWSNTDLPLISFEETMQVLSFSFKDYFICCTTFSMKLLVLWLPFQLCHSLPSLKNFLYFYYQHIKVKSILKGSYFHQNYTVSSDSKRVLKLTMIGPIYIFTYSYSHTYLHTE